MHSSIPEQVALPEQAASPSRSRAWSSARPNKPSLPRIKARLRVWRDTCPTTPCKFSALPGWRGEAGGASTSSHGLRLVSAEVPPSNPASVSSLSRRPMAPCAWLCMSVPVCSACAHRAGVGPTREDALWLSCSSRSLATISAQCSPPQKAAAPCSVRGLPCMMTCKVRRWTACWLASLGQVSGANFAAVTMPAPPPSAHGSTPFKGLCAMTARRSDSVSVPTCCAGCECCSASTVTSPRSAQAVLMLRYCPRTASPARRAHAGRAALCVTTMDVTLSPTHVAAALACVATLDRRRLGRPASLPLLSESLPCRSARLIFHDPCTAWARGASSAGRALRNRIHTGTSGSVTRKVVCNGCVGLLSTPCTAARLQ